MPTASAHRTKNFTELLALWPTIVSIERDTGYPYVSVRYWKTENWIPEGAWEAIIGAAEVRGIRGVTLARLRRFQAKEQAARDRRKAERAASRTAEQPSAAT